MRRHAFTLVELLVVIGIIAVLISILLPTLGEVRQRGRAVKCLSSLREIGTAMTFYAKEHKTFYPPAQLVPHAGHVYNVEGTNFPSGGVGAYWFNFIGRYVTRARVGTASTNDFEAVQQRSTVLWGCPEWEGYRSTALGGFNRVQPGYGMNLWPTFGPGYPTGNFPPVSERNFIQSWTPAQDIMQGRWTKRSVYDRQAAERALVADSRFWISESNPAPADGTFPPQSDINNIVTYSAPNQTTVDVYRHGKRPGPGPVPNTVAQRGGRVSYNMLYCDGHVASESDQMPAYKALRMRFPN